MVRGEGLTPVRGFCLIWIPVQAQIDNGKEKVQTRKLGRSEIRVSPMGLGCWAIGGPWNFRGEAAGWGEVDDRESIKAIHRALDLGINFFDTAANYGCGHSERILGQALGDRRHKVVIATKFGFVVDEQAKAVEDSDDPVRRVREECEQSLRRLGSDYIDVYQLHVWDLDFERAIEIREQLEDLVAEGKIRTYGWSTDDPERAQIFAEGGNCSVMQHVLNIMHDASEMLAVCEAANLASINRTPLLMGVLTGKFNADSKFPENDVRHEFNFQEGVGARRLEQIEALREVLTQGGRSLAQAALGWIWARSERTIPIPGFKNIAQVEENIGAMAFGPLSDDQMREIDAILERKSLLDR
jgi:aryl-alcohol dehydrogenase-like predicted oxidoreductase